MKKISQKKSYMEVKCKPEMDVSVAGAKWKTKKLVKSDPWKENKNTSIYKKK